MSRQSVPGIVRSFRFGPPLMPFVDFPFCLKQVCQIVSVFAIALLPKLMRPLGDLFLGAQIVVILAVDCTHLLTPTRRTRRDSLVCGRSGLRPSPGLGDRLLKVLFHSPNQKCAGFPDFLLVPSGRYFFHFFQMATPPAGSPAAMNITSKSPVTAANQRKPVVDSKSFKYRLFMCAPAPAQKHPSYNAHEKYGYQAAHNSGSACRACS